MARGQGLAQQGQGRPLSRRAAGAFRSSRSDDVRHVRHVHRPRPRAAAALLLALALPAAAGPELAPDIVLLVADDLGVHLPSFRGGSVPTPALDRLASEGVSFEYAYAAAPNCTPSRASMLTGLYPFAHGAVGYGPIAADVETLPSLLARAGYASHALGKLGVGAPRAEQLPAQLDGAPDTWPAEVARLLAAPQPVLLWIGLGDPHRPFPTPDPEAAEFAGELPGYLFDTPETRAELAGYAAAVRRLDRRVGALLAAIDAAPRERPVVVVFVSDNGPAFPFGKATLYEAGIRVPLVVRWPAGVRAVDRAALVSLVDLAPTLLELAGVEVPAGLHGRSLARPEGDGSEVHREALLATIEEVYTGPPLPARSLRLGPWKYLRHYETQRPYTTASTHTATFRSWTEHFETCPELEDRCRRFVERRREQLFDLAADPFELRDLSEEPSARARLLALRERLDATLRELGDPRAPAADR